MGKQKLGRVSTVAAEALVIGPDEVRLADRGGGLKLRQVVGPLLQTKLADSLHHDAGADQGDLAARVHDGADLLGEMMNPSWIKPSVVTGQDVGPHLDDPDARREHDLVANQITDDGLGKGVCARDSFSGLWWKGSKVGFAAQGFNLGHNFDKCEEMHRES